jgi:hypothetical protein
VREALTGANCATVFGGEWSSKSSRSAGLGSTKSSSWRRMGNRAMRFIECKVSSGGPAAECSASMSLEVRPVEDQPINVRVDGGEWVKAKITL